MSTEPTPAAPAAAPETITLGDEPRPPRARAQMFSPPAYTPDVTAYDPDPKIAKKLEALDGWAAKGVTIRAVRTSTKVRAARTIELKPGMKAAEADKTFREALRSATLREDFSTGDDFTAPAGPPGPNNPEQEFLQVLGGPFSKQLYLAAYLDMHAKCWWELTHNPMARLMVELQTDYVVGRGVKFQAKDEKFQELYDREERRLRLQQRIRQFVYDESWQGEAMLRKYRNAKGQLTLREIDPSTIWEVIANPEDTEEVAGYWQNYPGAYNIATMDNVPMSSYTVAFIPAADILHSKVNVSSGEKRGRSDMFPALGWFKRLRDFTASIVLAAQHAYAYVYDVEIDGDLSDIQAVINDPNFSKVPVPGSSWLHNKAMKVQPMSSKIGTGFDATKEITHAILRMCAASFGMPLEYLGVVEGGSKANAIAKTSPWAKRVSMRQLHVESELLIPLKDAIYDSLVESGELKPEVSRGGEWTFPEPAPEDVDARLKRLALLRREGAISHERFSTAGIAEANITQWNYAEEQTKIQQEIAAGITKTIDELNDAAAQKAEQDVDKVGAAPGGGTGGGGRMSPGDRAGYKDDATHLK